MPELAVDSLFSRHFHPQSSQVFNLTADFIALLPGGSKKWYTHALKHHVIEQMVMFPTALISTSTTEGQQKRQVSGVAHGCMWRSIFSVPCIADCPSPFPSCSAP